MKQIEKSLFSTWHLPSDQRLPAWRESIGSIFDIAPLKGRTEGRFNARLCSYLLDEKIMLSRCDTTAQRFERTPLRIARDGLDYYLVQTHLRGSQRIRRGGAELKSDVGDLHVIDLADKHAAETTDFSHLTLVIPRHLLAPHLKYPDSQEGRVIKGDQALAALTVNHMRMLAGLAETTLNPDEAARTVAPTLMLLAGALNGNSDSLADGAGAAAISLQAQARQKIEQHLHEDLSVDRLSALLGMSRTSLYRLFESAGGVRAYVQERRLQRCAKALVSREGNQRCIYDIAYDWGFRSEAHFSRAFKQRFGLSPREVQHEAPRLSDRGTLDVTEALFGDRHYEHWLASTLKCA